MSLVTRSTMRGVRALHTSARILNESSSSSLGFGDYSDRTRKLPTIPISASSQRNVVKSRPQDQGTATVTGTKSDDQQRAGRQGQRQRPGQGQGRDGQREGGNRQPHGPPGQRKKRQDRSPIQASLDKTRQTQSGDQFPLYPKSSQSGEEQGDDFFGDYTSRSNPARGRGSNLKKVDLDISAVNLPSTNRLRTPRSSSSTNTKRNNNNNKTPEADKRSSAPPRVKAKPVAEVEDRSPAGLFGRMSLLFPVRRGAREAESSIWANGMKPDEGKSLLIQIYKVTFMCRDKRAG